MPKGVPTTRGADGNCLVHWLGGILGLTAALFSLGASAQLSVSESGSPIYSHPIAVPPGIGNLVPNIGLLYAAGAVNGPVGHGWSIQGMSAITRCAGIRAIDGSPRAVDFSGDDKLCLDGQRLIQTDANGAPSAFPQLNDSLGGSGLVREYRTEKESGARIRAYGSAAGVAANGPAYFKVWTKGGQIYEYGDNANSTAKAAITVQGGDVVSLWAVSRISDTLGNYIDFQYEQREVAWGSGPTANSPTPGKEWNLLEIRYTGTSTAPPMNRVQFVYSDRPVAPADRVQDRAETYHHGKKNVSVRRLDAVKTYTNWSGGAAPHGAIDATPYPADPAAGAIKVKAVKLAYEQGPVTNRSRVKTITECVGASEAQCLPPVTFNYAAGGNDAYASSTAFGASGMATATLASASGSYGIIPIDFNGDGTTDILRWSTTPAENVLYKSLGNGGFTQVPNGTAAGQFNITEQQLFGANGCFVSMVADFNGDGLPDLLRYSAPTNLDGVACASSGPILSFINNGDGTFTQYAYQGPALTRTTSKSIDDCLVNRSPNGYCLEPADHKGWTAGANFFLLDANGDGRLDIITTVLPYYGKNDPVSDACASIVCTRVYKGNGDGTFTEIPTNLANRSIYVAPAKGTGLGAPRNITDGDGDGLTDLTGIATWYFNKSSAFSSQGDGNFVASTLGTSCEHPIDFNGDGRGDCLTFSTTPSTNTLHASVGVGSLVKVADFNLTTAADAFRTIKLTNLADTAGIVTLDANGDGREDILRWSEVATDNKVYLSNGDGSFTVSSAFNLNTAADLLRSSDDTASFQLGDFLGNGTPQILRLRHAPTAGAATSNQLYAKFDPTPPDQLISVTGPTGLSTSLIYTPLSLAGYSELGARYSSDRSVPGRANPNAAVYPKVDVTAPIYVVTKSETDIGVGPAKVATEYSYAGLKANLTGRGNLGFREVRRQSPGPNGAALSIVTQYLQDFPYTGSVKHSETRLGALNAASPQVLSSSDFWYCDKTAEAGAEVPSVTFTPGTPCPSTAKVVRPYLRQSVESGKDLTGNALPTVTTLNTFSNSINPTQIAVSIAGSVGGVSQTVTKTTTNTYYADNTSDDNWVLGQLQTAQQRNIVTDGLAQLGAPAAGSNPNAGAVRGAPAIAGSVSDIAFGSLPVGSSSTLSATLTNIGSAALAVTAPSAASVNGADFSFIASACTSSLAPTASCTISVKFQPTAGAARSGSLSVVTSAGTLSGTLTGAGTVSSVSVTANNAAALSANKGGANASGTVTFTNSGDQAATLTLSGLSAPYSVAPASCVAQPGGGTCVVTVAMTTGGAFAEQGAQTLSAAGASNGTVTASVAGTLNGSGVALSSNGASALSAVKGAAAASGNVTFTNSGNQAATLTLSGLSEPYSVAPASCVVAAGGGTCVATVTMTTGGAFGEQGAQTLMATGATTGAATAPVAGTLNGSAVTLTANNAAALTADKAGANASGTVTFTNSGNQAATLTLGGLSAPYSVAPASCTAAAGGGTCVATVTMTTGGAFGGQGGQTLTAAGATTGAATAPVAGTLNGSAVALTTNNAAALSANKAGANASGAVTFTNSGNQAAALTLSGLSAPYSVTPDSCSAAASGGTCVVTVTMTTGGAIGSQGAQTLTAAGATGGNATTSVAGTLTGTVATLTSVAPDLGDIWYGTAAPSANVTLRNDGNASMTLSALSGLSSRFQLSANTCTGVAPAASCTMTISMPTSTAGSSPNAVSTVGATTEAAFTISGRVNSAVSRWGSTSLAFGSVNVGSSSTQNIAVFNDGFGVNTNWAGALANLPTGFSANTSACASVAPGASCSVGITFSPTTGQAYSGASIYPSNGSYANNTLTVSGTGLSALPAVSASPTALSFGAVGPGLGKLLTLAVTNSGTGAANVTGFAIVHTSGGRAGFYSWSSTCGTTLGPSGSCTVTVAYDALCEAGSSFGTLTMSGSNFPSVVTQLSASTRSGICY